MDSYGLLPRTQTGRERTKALRGANAELEEEWDHVRTGLGFAQAGLGVLNCEHRHSETPMRMRPQEGPGEQALQ